MRAIGKLFEMSGTFVELDIAKLAGFGSDDIRIAVRILQLRLGL